MKLWLITQVQNRYCDTYRGAIVVAETEEDARQIHPDGEIYSNPPIVGRSEWHTKFPCWASHPSEVTVKLIGDAKPGVSGVVLASFSGC